EIDGPSSTLLPGICALAAYGHTPGHTMYLVESENEKFLIWGDLIHAMAIQMPYPEVAVTYDIDPVQAVKSRQETLKFIEKNKIPVGGIHIAFPGMGKISQNDKNGYVFTPLK
ncbi:MAG: MBL fold metallo-hydrolase, partial [Prolixibacteraceae bacterium]|nr:MBL fold metallo-hydrolase [Prolixibacteraceae bacterium]